MELSRQPGFPSARQTFLLALLFAVLGLLPQALSRTLPDIAFPLWAADRMQHGARLYVDILEINPPLFIWLDLPLTWLASVTDIGAITWYRVATSLLLFASLAGCWWALEKGLGDEPPAYRRLHWLAAAFALLLLPRLDWGEREHLSLALTLPYILLGIARARGKSVGKGGAIVAGLAAGIGIALKPYFVLVWVGREVASRGSWVAGRTSQVSNHEARLTTPATRDPRPETFAVPAICLIYLASVILIHPEYFHLLRELGLAYSRFLRNSVLITLFLGDGSAIVIGALIVALALRAIPRHSAVWRVLIGSMLGYFLAAVIQAKGWRYHFYPALGLAMLLFATMAWDAWQRSYVIPRKHAPAKAVAMANPLMRIFAAIPVSALATAVLVAGVLAGAQIIDPLNPRYDADPSIGALIPIVKQRAQGRSVFVMSPNMASGFPLTNYAGTQWPSRLSNMWPAVVAYDSATKMAEPVRFRSLDSLTPVEQFGLETTIQDLISRGPPLMLVLRAVDQKGWGMQRLDMLTFLRRDPRFGAAWAAYDSLGVAGNYTLWARGDDAVASAPLQPMAPGGKGGENLADEAGLSPVRVVSAGIFIVLLAFTYRRTRPQPS